MGSLRKNQASGAVMGAPFALQVRMGRSLGKNLLDRRDFVRSLVSGVSVFALSRSSILDFSGRAAVVIGVLTPGGRRSAQTTAMLNGIILGLSEAQRASALFQRPLLVFRRSYDSPASLLPAATSLLRDRVQVLIGGETESDVRSISKFCMMNGVVFLNAASRSDSLRRESCSSFVYHVEASDAMYQSARALAAGTILLWHPSLTRYGAAQLNDRYRARFGTPMNGTAWAGWMSVKVAWEAALRASQAGSSAIAAQLAKDDSQFDGHKGAPLSFRIWDHQLRQPLYSAAGGNNSGSAPDEVTDVPDLARSSLTARDLLDTLGDKTSEHSCSPS